MSLRAAVTKSLSDWPLLTAIGICLVATALRIPPLGESLWLDELHTAWCALGPLDEVARRAAIGNQGPLFYWLEWLQVVILGESEVALRLPSLVAGTLLPLLLFRLARRWKADTAGVVAAGLIAVDPLSIFYSTEARPYAIVQLLAVVFMAVTAQVAEKPSVKLRIAWILLAAALFHLHYTSALVVAAAAVFLASTLVLRRKPLLLAGLIVDLLVLAIVCSLALANVSHILAHRSNWTFVRRLPLWDAIQWTPLPTWAWLILVSAAVISWWLSPNKSNQNSRPQTLLLVVAWLAIPLITGWVLTSTDFARLFFHRYVAAAFPAAALLAGFCVEAIPGHRLKSVVAISTVGIALFSGGIIDQVRLDGRVIADRNEDWRSCVEWLNERVPAAGYPVLVYSGLIEADELMKPHDPLLDNYCLCPVDSLYMLDVAPTDLFPLSMHNPDELPATAEQLAVHRGGCWLVVRGTKELAENIAIPIGKKLQPTMPKRGGFSIQSFGKVQVVLFQFE
jgi:4-amino-4-deoxy-L-arabinose transferase-like glycosyltransferase